jgi:hypothetical protein
MFLKLSNWGILRIFFTKYAILCISKCRVQIKLNRCRNYKAYAIVDFKMHLVKPSYSQAKSPPQSWPQVPPIHLRVGSTKIESGLFSIRQICAAWLRAIVRLRLLQEVGRGRSAVQVCIIKLNRGRRFATHGSDGTLRMFMTVRRSTGAPSLERK